MKKLASLSSWSRTEKDSLKRKPKIWNNPSVYQKKLNTLLKFKSKKSDTMMPFAWEKLKSSNFLLFFKR